MVFNYDPEGRLAYISTDGGVLYKSYLYDGVNLIAEYDSGGNMLSRYVHGSGTDNPLLWFTGSGTSLQYFITDYHGSIIGTAATNGVRMELYRYDPYGVPYNYLNQETWGGSAFRYTGQTTIPEARLYYYKARVYDPKYGRFLQTDPIGSKDDLDLYAYTAGDPVNAIDPTGKVIQVNDLTDRKLITSLINKVASGTFNFNNDGNLEMSKSSSAKGFSSYYSDKLQAAISSKSTITVQVSQTTLSPTGGGITDVDKNDGGGNTIGRKGDDQLVTISGHPLVGLFDTNGNPLRDTPSDILAHELVGHAIPNMIGSDTGNAVSNENKVRAETDGKLRAPEPLHHE